MSEAERTRWCESCGAEVGLTGPCPDCGTLPPLQVMGIDDAPSSAVAQVSLPRRKQRTAAVVVAVVVALVAMSVVWDPGSGDDAAAESEDGADAQPTEPTEPTGPDSGGQDPGRGTTPPARSEPVHEVESVPRFEDHWLLVVDQGTGRVTQIPLGGGEVVEVLPMKPSGSMMVSFPAMMTLVDGVLVGNHGGVSLLDGTRWEIDNSMDNWEYVIGVSDGGTIISTGNELRERSLDGELINSWGEESLNLGPSWDAVLMDRVLLQSGPYGLLSFDLDTGRTRRVAQGLLVTTEGEVMAVSVCDDELECEIELRHGPTGWRISGFEAPAQSHGYFGVRANYSHRPSLSPDVSRLVLFDPDRGLEFFDTRTGELLGSVDLPEHTGREWSHGTIEVMWAPSSETALVIISDGGLSTSVVQVDRDLGTVEPRQQLADAITTASGSMAALVLADRGFDPVDSQPQP